jgi:hypothetical protein
MHRQRQNWHDLPSYFRVAATLPAALLLLLAACNGGSAADPTPASGASLGLWANQLCRQLSSSLTAIQQVQTSVDTRGFTLEQRKQAAATEVPAILQQLRNLDDGLAAIKPPADIAPWQNALRSGYKREADTISAQSAALESVTSSDQLDAFNKTVAGLEAEKNAALAAELAKLPPARQSQLTSALTAAGCA